jgi:hypothetical protein
MSDDESHCTVVRLQPSLDAGLNTSHPIKAAQRAVIPLMSSLLVFLGDERDATTLL